MSLTLEQANALLPTTKVSTNTNPLSLVYTLIAEPKWGKTTWFSQFPNALLVAFEQGHSFIEGYKVVIDAWAEKNSAVITDGNGLTHMTFLDFVEILTASDQYDFIIIDTADMAAKMCVDYNMRQIGIKHPSDMDFGKGYEMGLNAPFRQAMGRIIKSGRGIGFITHTETKDARFSSGKKARKECTLPGGVVKFVIPQSDVVLHGKFGIMNNKTKKRDRILVTEGSDDMLAGTRVQGKISLPSRFIVDKNNPWEQWNSFFNDSEASTKAEQQYTASTRAPQDASYEETAPTAEEPQATVDPIPPAKRAKAK